MEYVLIAATLIAVLGAYLNSIGRWQGFALWILTNFVFIVNNLHIGQWQQAFLFATYMVISINGLKNAFPIGDK
jgi:hypothetical protein